MGKLKVTEYYSKNDIRYYGAIGDGIHDDTNAILNAINNVKNIIFDEGIYVVNQTIMLKSNSFIDGKNAILKRNGNFHLLEIAPHVHDVKIMNLHVDGDFKQYSLIYVEGHSNMFSKCKIYNTDVNGHGICFDGQRSKVCKFNKVENCMFDTCKGVSISNNMSYENMFLNNIILNSGLEALTLDNYSRYTLIKNNIIRNNCVNDGVGSIGVDASSYSIISENIISQCNNKPGITTQTNIHGSSYNIIIGNIITGLDTTSGTNYGIEIHSYNEDSTSLTSKHPRHNLITSNITQYGISSKPENIISTNIQMKLPVIIHHYSLNSQNFDSFDENVAIPHKIYSYDDLSTIDLGFKTGQLLIRIKTIYNLSTDAFTLSFVSNNSYFQGMRYSIDDGNSFHENSFTVTNLSHGNKSIIIDIIYNNTEIIPHWTNTTDILEITINGTKDYSDKLSRPAD